MFSRFQFVFLTVTLLFVADSVCRAEEIKLAKPTVQRWQVGLVVSAQSPSAGIMAAAPVPDDWPEQKVKIVKTDKTPNVRQIRFRKLSGGAKQMLVEIPRLAAGETARAVLTFEISRSAIEGPEDTSDLTIPTRLPQNMRLYLSASPMIETTNAMIRKTAREVAGDKKGWARVEAIYDWVRDNVEYKEGSLKGAVAALRDGTGDCEELTSLFIALCRVNRIPARTVWVPGHCYPEFYLQDEQGRGHWFPCQAAGTRAFGSIPENRIILQKGDNIRVPELRGPQRYASATMKVTRPGRVPPTIQFIRQPLNQSPAGQ